MFKRIMGFFKKWRRNRFYKENPYWLRSNETIMEYHLRIGLMRKDPARYIYNMQQLSEKLRKNRQKALLRSG